MEHRGVGSASGKFAVPPDRSENPGQLRARDRLHQVTFGFAVLRVCPSKAAVKSTKSSDIGPSRKQFLGRFSLPSIYWITVRLGSIAGFDSMARRFSERRGAPSESRCLHGCISRSAAISLRACIFTPKAMPSGLGPISLGAQSHVHLRHGKVRLINGLGDLFGQWRSEPVVRRA